MFVASSPSVRLPHIEEPLYILAIKRSDLELAPKYACVVDFVKRTQLSPFLVDGTVGYFI